MFPFVLASLLHIMFSGSVLGSSLYPSVCVSLSECCCIVWTDHVLFILLPVDGHWGHLHFADVMNNAAMNMPAQISVWT